MSIFNTNIVVFTKTSRETMDINNLIAGKKMETIPKKLLRIKDVQERLGVSRSYIYILMDKGILESRKIGNARRVLEHSLDKLIEQGYENDTEQKRN